MDPLTLVLAMCAAIATGACVWLLAGFGADPVRERLIAAGGDLAAADLLQRDPESVLDRIGAQASKRRGRTHARMLQAALQLGFECEAPAILRAQDPAAQEFHGKVPIERNVPRQIDHPHSAFAQFLLYLIMGNGLAYHFSPKR